VAFHNYSMNKLVSVDGLDGHQITLQRATALHYTLYHQEDTHSNQHVGRPARRAATRPSNS
jgi:hypothetical protein